MIILENEHITASFTHKGAELQRFKSKKNNIEYLWDGNPDYWPRFSPVLFPIVGALENNTYYFKNKAYQLPKHGFARDMDFIAEQISDTEVLFTLSHSDETLEVYPFPFILQLRYTLSGAEISCTYEVTNPGTDPLLFSIGAHPAFAIPLQANGQYTDCFLQFNKDTTLVYHKITRDCIDHKTVEIELKDGILPLNHELFYEDALVLKSLKSDCISICTYHDPHGIHFRFTGFPYFGIWSARDADFVCLEPWCGIADGIDHNQQLQHKEGIISLDPDKKWSRTWQAECF